MSTRGIVLTVVGAFLFAMSVLGLFESVHHSAKILYSVLIPVSLIVLALGLRSRKASP